MFLLKKTIILSPGLLMALLFLPCLSGSVSAQLADTPWPMFQQNPQHTGQSSFEGPDSIVLAWTFETVGWIVSQPVLANDGTIYFLADDEFTKAKLFAVNKNGTLKWSYEVPGDLDEVTSTPAIGDDGTLYVQLPFEGWWNSGLFAFNSNGTVKWKRKISESGDWLSSPVIGTDGTIYVGSANDTLYAFNPDGSAKWRFGAGDDILASPALASDGAIYIGSLDKNFYAVNPDGTLKWKYEGEEEMQSSPAIGADGTIYFISGNRNSLYSYYSALDSDGALKWKERYQNAHEFSPSIGPDSTIYFSAGGPSKLFAYHPDGTQKWELSLSGYTYSSSPAPLPAIDKRGFIYYGMANAFHLISPEGTIEWSQELDGLDVSSSVTIGADGWIYVGAGLPSYQNKPGKLFAFARASTGATPDLMVDKIIIDPKYGSTPGGNIKIGARVRDLSGQAAARCEVAFYYDNTSQLIGKSSAFVPVGDFGFAEVSWRTQNFEIRDYQITAIVLNSDPAESDTTNNSADTTYTLLATIQSQIDNAQEGDTVWVDPGGYFENISLKNGVVVKSRLGPEVTIIDGRGAALAVNAAGRNRSAVLEGFTIRNGKGNILTGGGIDLDLSSATIKGNIITGNDPYGIHHRGFQSAWVEGNLIVGSTGSFGWGISANNSQAIFINNTIVGNNEGIHAIGFYVPSPTIVNCILWGNGEDLSGTARAIYTNTRDGDSGLGNISIDPQFVDPANGDYRLQLTSPCLDAGDPTILDADGTRSDMGAYPVFQGGGRFGAPINLTAMSESDRIILHWQSPPSQLDVSIDQLTFDTYDLGWAFFLENTGLGRMRWTASTDQPWLSLLPDTGVVMLGRGQLIAFASRKNLAVGEYTGNILVTSNGGNKTIPVTLKVGNTPESGKWAGTSISFTVSESMRRVRNLTFTKSSGNQSFKFEFNSSVAIDSNQAFSIVSGDITIEGTFDSRKTVSGTYRIPFNPSPSGNWSANWKDGNMGKSAANSTLSGEIASDLQIIAGYNIYRRTGTGSFDSVLASVSGNIFNYIDSTVVAGESYYYVVDAYDQNGQLSEKSNETGPVVTDIKSQEGIPNHFALSQNYPNPFNPETTIKYQLPKATEVKLTIYNLLGQQVATLVEKKQPAGYYAVKWHGKDQFGNSVASGVYLYRIQASEFVKVRKLTLIR